MQKDRNPRPSQSPFHVMQCLCRCLQVFLCHVAPLSCQGLSDQIDNPVSELNVSLNVSLPISIYVNGCVTSINMLSHRLAMLKLPPQWVVASNTLLTLCTIGLQDTYCPCVIVSIVFYALLEWTATIA